MKITIIGSGNVGRTLGARWAGKGHEIVFGSRDPESTNSKEIENSVPGAKVVGIKDAAAASGIVVLATPWPAAKSTIKAAGGLKGKILIDCTNPLAPDQSGLTIGPNTSAAEKISEWAEGAFVVKAFNNTGSGNMADPVYGDGKVSMFVCGDDLQAKKTAMKMASDIDFDVVDAGPLSAARYLESLAKLWIHLAYVMELGPDIAFRLMRR